MSAAEFGDWMAWHKLQSQPPQDAEPSEMSPDEFLKRTAHG